MHNLTHATDKKEIRYVDYYDEVHTSYLDIINFICQVLTSYSPEILWALPIEDFYYTQRTASKINEGRKEQSPNV